MSAGDSPERVGVVGLGRMGLNIAERLVASGVQVVGYDIAPERRALFSAEVAEGMEEVCATCDTIILSLPKTQHVASFVDDVLRRDTADLAMRTVIDMGTSLPSTQEQLAEDLAAIGIDFIDSPVSGGPARARTGELLLTVGGPQPAVERVRSLLEHLSVVLVHAGSHGSGTRLKLLNNGIVAATALAVGEAVHLSVSAGIDPELLLTALNSGSASGYVVGSVVSPFVRGEVEEPRFTYEQLFKDVGYLCDTYGTQLKEASALRTGHVILSHMDPELRRRDFGDPTPWLTE